MYFIQINNKKLKLIVLSLCTFFTYKYLIVFFYIVPATTLKALTKTLFTGMCLRSVTQSCPALCDPMDCSLPGSSAQGIFQSTILEWVAISPSKGLSWPRDWTCISCVLQAYLRDILSSVPDHCNKMNIAIKWVTHVFDFPIYIYCKKYVYTIL